MGMWPLNANELLQNASSVVSKPTLQNLALQSFVRNLDAGNVSEKVESLPTKVMIDALEKLCEHPAFIQDLLSIMLKPSNLARILGYNERYQWKLVKCFQYLEIEKTSFVKQLVKNVVELECLGYTSNLKLGNFLAETGWHSYAVQVFEVALKQAGVLPLRQLEVMGPLLISQVYTKHSNVKMTTETIISKMSDVELPLELRISSNLTLSIKYFEAFKFRTSYQYAVEAFHLLNQQSSPKQVIEIFSHLSKTCIPLKLFRQAKLLITQAVALARKHYRSPSEIYARALEDYALYLVTVNSIDDGMNLFSEAQQTLLQLYGPRNLQQTVSQGNLCFGVYLQAYVYRDLTVAKQYLRNIADLMRELNPADGRLMVAIGKAEALLAGDIERVRGRWERDMEQRDRLEKEQQQQPALKVGEVQRLFRGME